MNVIASDAVKGRMLKIKFGELVGKIGGLEAAASFCRVGKSTLARYASNVQSDAECFAPIDVVRDLEALAGEPVVTSTLCAMADGVFVAVPNTPAATGDLLAMMSALSGEFNDTTRVICAGLADGNFCAVDAAKLERELDDVIRVAVGMRALARSIHGGDR
jgi:hypothetical protein